MSRPSRSPSSACARYWNARRGGWRRAWELLADSLDEHPVFELNDVPNSRVRPGVVEAAELGEAQREPLYLEQWLRVFLLRLRLTSIIGILCLLVFVGFSFCFSRPLTAGFFWSPRSSL